MQLVDGLYAYPWDGEGNNANSYTIKYLTDGTPRYAVIDPGLVVVPTSFGSWPKAEPGANEAPGIGTLLTKMAGDGIQPEQIGLVIITHAHSDHCEAAPELRRRGAKVAMNQAEAKRYCQVVIRAYHSGELKDDELHPDLFLKEGMLDLGRPAAVHLQVIRTPGHSSGAISLWWQDKKALFCGDTVFYHSVGRTDLPDSNSNEMKASVRRLSEFKAEYLLTGHAYGHSGVIEGADEVARNFHVVVNHVLPFV
ncbi:MAG: MBL fold metallo-hydrolase [Chloroflexi bacterium]|nr:MBL fold metallo-hydrolase [Chloroflexota bacterium]